MSVRVVTCLLGAALACGCRREATGSSGEQGTDSRDLSVLAVTGERSGDHVHLTVRLRVANNRSTPVTLTPPAVQLWAEHNRAVPAFLAAGLMPATVAAESEGEADTHWWLAADDVAGALEIEFTGARQTVKTAAPFAFTSLPEGKSVRLPVPSWKTGSP
jgi:hypothetical protein